MITQKERIMSHQLTFADSEFSNKRRETRKEIFLSRMDALLPWPQLLEVVEPPYPKAGNGRHPYPLETMLRGKPGSDEGFPINLHLTPITFLWTQEPT